MTIKERIQALFKKPVKPSPYVEFEKKDVPYEDVPEKVIELSKEIRDELDLWDNIDVDLPEEATIDLVSLFESTFKGKHALWGGKETKAFIKYKEQIMGE